MVKSILYLNIVEQKAIWHQKYLTTTFFTMVSVSISSHVASFCLSYQLVSDHWINAFKTTITTGVSLRVTQSNSGRCKGRLLALFVWTLLKNKLLFLSDQAESTTYQKVWKHWSFPCSSMNHLNVPLWSRFELILGSMASKSYCKPMSSSFMSYLKLKKVLILRKSDFNI